MCAPLSPVCSSRLRHSLKKYWRVFRQPHRIIRKLLLSMRTEPAYQLTPPHWKQEQIAVPSPNVVAPAPSRAAPVLALGLRANAAQFALLMLINAFVGGMVGLERTVVPLIGTETFGLLLNTAVVSFIISFGVVKACMNLVSGVLADRYGRKRLLVLGWLVGLPVPFLIIWAPNWSWIVAANILLGINQGLTWSMAVIMKIDLAGPRQRGIAVGFKEFSG